MNDRDRYYKILGLTPTATPEQVKQAYRKLAKQWHPDRFIDRPHLQLLAQQEISKINQAYAILKNAPSQSKTERIGRDRVFKTVKNASEIHYQRGVEFAEAEAYEKAIAEFTLAIKIDKNYLKAYQYRSFILAKLGYELRAERDFKKVASLKNQAAHSSNERISYHYPNYFQKKSSRSRKFIAIAFLSLVVITLTILF